MNSCTVNSRPSNPRYQAIVDKITGTYGMDRIIVFESDTDNACATMHSRGHRIITYNRRFVNYLEGYGETVVKAVFAHEVGHHYHGHIGNLFDHDPFSYQRELQADKFAGHAVRYLGLNLEDAQQLYDLLGWEGSHTHPGGEARRNAMAKGWLDAHQQIHDHQASRHAQQQQSGWTWEQIGKAALLGVAAIGAIGLVASLASRKK